MKELSFDDAFPKFILIELLKYLDLNSILNCGLICKKFYNAMKHESLWKYMNEK